MLHGGGEEEKELCGSTHLRTYLLNKIINGKILREKSNSISQSLTRIVVASVKEKGTYIHTRKERKRDILFLLKAAGFFLLSLSLSPIPSSAPEDSGRGLSRERRKKWREERRGNRARKVNPITRPASNYRNDIFSYLLVN